jgi:hypothetical protein
MSLEHHGIEPPGLAEQEYEAAQNEQNDAWDGSDYLNEPDPQQASADVLAAIEAFKETSDQNWERYQSAVNPDAGFDAPPEAEVNAWDGSYLGAQAALEQHQQGNEAQVEAMLEQQALDEQQTAEAQETAASILTEAAAEADIKNWIAEPENLADLAQTVEVLYERDMNAAIAEGVDPEELQAYAAENGDQLYAHYAQQAAEFAANTVHGRQTIDRVFRR